MMSNYYILKDKKPVPVDGLLEWGSQFEDPDSRKVRRTHILNDWIFISTVFLGLDHRFGFAGPPLLFETMIFGGYLEDYQRRYSTWDEAVRGHYEAVFRAIITIPLILIKRIKL
jgi:hypothetical protein